jgi:DNA (cytosine-5)-methyltransferase 1
VTAFYNEIDPYAADWLRNLITAGHIAPGVVDTRSIEDIEPHELDRFTQCHFFAGIGVWSHSLRLAGWPDTRPVWTGSCPCQPFSAAGKGAGFSDERHLWPAWFHLVQQCRPAVVFGEQVASKNVEPWIDLVQSDLEAVGYAVGAVAFPSAGVGAPHIRDRCYFVAHADDARLERRDERTAGIERPAAERGGSAGLVAYDYGAGFSRLAGLRIRGAGLHDADGRGPVGGFWAGADWIACRDEKWRPVEPGTFPLAHGAPARVGRLRAYGNAINSQAARAFVESYLECELA